MKATVLIKKLQRLIDKHGDCNVYGEVDYDDVDEVYYTRYDNSKQVTNVNDSKNGLFVLE